MRCPSSVAVLRRVDSEQPRAVAASLRVPFFLSGLQSPRLVAAVAELDSLGIITTFMAQDTDWRLQGQERYLQGVALLHRDYRRYQKNPDWDHDHCEFCSGKFMVEDLPDVFHRGYCTEDAYHWICERCFHDFQKRFSWSASSDSQNDA